MTKTFNCASCSAPLEFEGTPAQKCRYCGSTVIAPTELFYASSTDPFGDFSSLSGKARRIAEIDQLIHAGKKVEAIKLFRETFDIGLAEAKEAVERMERGESVDISGMRLQSRRPATTADIDKVKKIGLTIGGSIIASILISVIAIGVITAAVIYFMWAAIDNKIPTGLSVTSSPDAPPGVRPASVPDMLDVLRIGGKGNGAGKFTDNRHVAVDGNGNIYSSDYSPHRIQVFEPGGKFVNQWAPESGRNLYDLAADADGNVYIANDKGVFKHEGATGKLLAKASLFPRGISLTWDKKLLVATRKSILLLDGSLQVLREWKDIADSGNSAFGFEKVATDGGGFIYALDTHANQICKFSAEGKFLDRFSTLSGSPHAIAIDPSGRLAISDTSHVNFLNTDNGERIKSVETSQAFGVAFDQQGHMLVASRPYVVKYKLNF